VRGTRLSDSTRQPQHLQQEQQQPQPSAGCSQGVIPESKPRQAAGQLSEPAKGERAERRGGGGSPQRADWQAKDRLLLSHNLVVWTQQGLTIWLFGHSRGS